MKILFVTPYYAPSMGGVQQYVKDLAEASRGEHEIIIVTTRLTKDQAAWENVGGIKIYRLPVLTKLANTPFHPRWKAHFRRIFETEQPDIINAHAPVPWFADMAQRAGRSRIPFVLTYHSGSMKKGAPVPDLLIGLYERFVLPKTLASSTRIVAVYPEFIRRIVGNTRPIAHITPGIDTDFFAPQSLKKKYDLMFAGRLEKSSSWKGVDTALQAVAILKKRDKTVSLLIAGDGDSRGEFEQMAQTLGIASQVTFAGMLSREQLRDLYNESRVLVLPSRTESESFGMVVAEAASCGVPAVGSNIGGIPHVIEDGVTGVLAQPDNPDSFAKAIVSLLGDSKRLAGFGVAARERVERLFSRKRLIDTTFELFESIEDQPYPKNIQAVAYYPPALGGMERVAENIAVELAEAGQAVEVVTSSIGYKPGFRDYKKEGYTVSRLGGHMVGGLPIVPSLFWHLVRQPRGSLYHVHVAQAFLPEVALLAARLRGGMFVAHFHLDVVPSGTFGAIFVAYKRTLFPYMLRHADRVIVFSDDQKKLVETKYGVAEERVVILPNGIRRGFERSEPRTPRQPLRLLFVGRLSQQKNIGFLLRSLQGVSSEFSTRIVGDGELRAELEKQAKALQLQNVVFAGRKDDDELRDEYDQADVFVLPSEREGMPLVLIDAMAMRLPAIGSDVLGIRDMIKSGKNGYLVPLNDKQAFQGALQQIAKSDKTYRQMSDYAYSSVRELTWPHLVRRLMKEVYS